MYQTRPLPSLLCVLDDYNRRPFFGQETFLRPYVEQAIPTDDGPEETWVVMLEFAPAPGGAPFDLDEVFSVIEALGAWDASGMYCADRYSVQLHVPARESRAAVDLAQAAHLRAARRPLPRLVGVEVLLQSEMEAAWDRDSDHEQASVDQADSAFTPREVYQATRSILAATTPADVVAELVKFVTAVGGTIYVGSRRPRPGEVSAELNIAGGPSLTAVAEAVSIGGLIFEECLPNLIHDARAMVRLLTGTAAPRCS